jgi:hypothetical protein
MATGASRAGRQIVTRLNRHHLTNISCRTLAGGNAVQLNRAQRLSVEAPAQTAQLLRQAGTGAARRMAVRDTGYLRAAANPP